MSSGENGDKRDGSMRYVRFTGKGSDFMEWKVKTLSLARKKGFKDYLIKDMDRKVDKYADGNAHAWDQLVLSLTGAPFNLILEAKEDAHKAWKILLNKYEVSNEKQESLTDVTIEWGACTLDGIRTDPDMWFSELFRINEKFEKIKVEYKKDEDSIKAHVIACLPEEYKLVKTNLYMNSQYDYIQYKTHIRHYWYAELGGKEITENGQTEEYVGKKKSYGTTDTEKAMNTNSGNGNSRRFN